MQKPDLSAILARNGRLRSPTSENPRITLWRVCDYWALGVARFTRNPLDLLKAKNESALQEGERSAQQEVF